MRREGEFSMAETVSLEKDHLVNVRKTLRGSDEVTTGPGKEREEEREREGGREEGGREEGGNDGEGRKGVSS